MEIDLVQGSGSREPLTRMWPNRASRREREDEDLLDSPEPSSPELSEDEDGRNNESDEPEFTSDDERPLVHVEISATDRLTADFQAHAVKAGMSLTMVVIYCVRC
jgi:hypothetical protein